MFCPECKCEYREGFTRCGSCEVDLIPEFTAAQETEVRTAVTGAPSAPLVEYCGFVELEEARSARDRLRAAGVHAEIVIRDLNVGRPEIPVEEEYWIRVPQNAGARIAAIVEDEGPPRSIDVACSECGRVVGHDETFCAHCGARFE